MSLNPEYYGNFQAPDIMGGIERGLAMSDKIKQRRAQDAEIVKQQKIQTLVSQNTLVDDQGNVSYGPGLAKSLAQAGYGQEAMQLQKQNQEMARGQKQMALEDAKYFVEMGSSLLTRAKQYPGSWGTVRQEMLKLPGINPAEIPEAHPGDKWIEQHETALMPMKEKLGLTKLEADIANTKANTWKTQQEAAKLRAETGKGPDLFKSLPVEKQKEIEKLADSNTNKKSIKNQIQAAIGNWDSLPDDQKYYIGQSLIKTMNSTQGQDAVGVDEREKLAGFLEFAKGNFTNQNPVQWGRNYPEFKKQMENIVSNLDKGIELNGEDIERAYGRMPAKKATPPDIELGQNLLKNIEAEIAKRKLKPNG
jgi:hypothetical protein